MRNVSAEELVAALSACLINPFASHANVTAGLSVAEATEAELEKLIVARGPERDVAKLHAVMLRSLDTLTSRSVDHSRSDIEPRLHNVLNLVCVGAELRDLG
jgi:hypothetical protein